MAKDDRNKGIGYVNYCVTGAIQSLCGVITGKKWKDHTQCKYSYASRYANRCMHFRFGKYCASTDAQKAKQTLK